MTYHRGRRTRQHCYFRRHRADHGSILIRCRSCRCWISKPNILPSHQCQEAFSEKPQMTSNMTSNAVEATSLDEKTHFVTRVFTKQPKGFNKAESNAIDGKVNWITRDSMIGLIVKPANRTTRRVQNESHRRAKMLGKYHITRTLINLRLVQLNAMSHNKEMSRRVTGTVTRCVSFVLSKLNISYLTRRESLDSVVLHILGDHSKCHRNWCNNKTRLSAEHSKQFAEGPLLAEVVSLMETFTGIFERLAPRRSQRLRKRFRRKPGTNKAPTKSFESMAITGHEFWRQHLSFDLESDSATEEYDIVDGKTDTGICIPPSLKPPPVDKLRISPKNETQVFFDIETTSLSLDCDILQLSARHEDNSFNVYIVPKKQIDKGASKVTGLTLCHGQLCYKGHQVDAKPKAAAAEEFMTWLEDISGRLILYGHNCKTFDCPRLLNLLKNCSMLERFSQKVLGFVDTLHLFRETFPNQSSYRQDALCATLLGSSYDAHNALEDVRGLSELVQQLSPGITNHVEYSFTTQFAIKNFEYSLGVKARTKSLQSLVDHGALSKPMARKVAQSGLSAEDLFAVFTEDSIDGIRKLFTDCSNGSVRVSACKGVIQQIQSYFWGQLQC